MLNARFILGFGTSASLAGRENDLSFENIINIVKKIVFFNLKIGLKFVLYFKIKKIKYNLTFYFQDLLWKLKLIILCQQ